MDSTDLMPISGIFRALDASEGSKSSAFKQLRVLPSKKRSNYRNYERYEETEFCQT